LFVSAFAWNKNSHNLFDFENNQHERKDFEVENTCKLVEKEKSLIPLNLNQMISQEQELFKIQFKQDGIVLVPDIKNFVKNDYL
jgi:hypothetical protein